MEEVEGSSGDDDERRPRALIDDLTGLPTSLALRPILASEIARVAQEDAWLALVIFDMDWFHGLNCVCGYSVGDSILAAVAQQLRAADRGEDTIARVGGNQFVMLLPGADRSEGYRIAERTRALVAAVEAPVEFTARFGRFSCTAGMVAVRGTAARGSDLLDKADKALFDAKARGRARTVVADG